MPFTLCVTRTVNGTPVLTIDTPEGGETVADGDIVEVHLVVTP